MPNCFEILIKTKGMKSNLDVLKSKLNEQKNESTNFIMYYPQDIEDFKLSLYNNDANYFIRILMLDIDNNFYENMRDLLAQISFLKKPEFDKLESYFNSKRHLRMVA